MAEARRMVRGESERLRVGYLVSAGQEYLGPALIALRRLHPLPHVRPLPSSAFSFLDRGLWSGAVDSSLQARRP
jgi:DNA-binding transcriptional LysR family regulator